MLKHVHSEIVNLGAPYFHHVKLLFDSKNISGSNIFRGLVEETLSERFFKEDQKWNKTANLSQNCPKMVIRNFCRFDRRCFEQKRL